MSTNLTFDDIEEDEDEEEEEMCHYCGLNVPSWINEDGEKICSDCYDELVESWQPIEEAEG